MHERLRGARKRRLHQRFGRFAPVAKALRRESAAERNWRRGAEGEEIAAARLESRLRGTGVKVLYDRKGPGKRGNIDILCVGPAGVTIVDAKRWRGKARVRRGRLMVGSHDRTSIVEGVIRQVEIVRRALMQSGSGDVSVRGAICWVELDGLPLIRRLEVDGVLIDGTRGIERRLLRGTHLTPDQIRRVTQLLEAALPPAA